MSSAGLKGERQRLKELLEARSSAGLPLYPLSQNQASLWFLEQVSPGNAAYNVGFAGRTRSALDIDILRGALARLAERHPSLQAVLRDMGGRPLQVVRKERAPGLEVRDAAGWSEADLAANVAEDYERPFELDSQPGLRAVVYRLAPDDHVLLLVVHHAMLDLWSLSVLLGELGALYAEPASVLPPVGGDYAQFVRWQADFLASEDGARQRAYWLEQLDDAQPVLNLATDRPRQPSQTLRGDSVTFTVDPTLTAALTALAREQRASTYALLLSAFQILLSHYTEQQDVLVGSPVAGRSRAEFDGVVGHFVNMIVLRGRLDGDPVFRTLLQQVRDAALGAVEHQDFPFAHVVEGLQVPRDASRPALFQACFALQKAPKMPELTGFMVRAPGAPPLDLGGLSFEPYPLSQQQGQFDVSLWMAEAEGALHGELKYNTDLFDRTTAERMAVHFQTLLASIVESPDAPLSALSILPEHERHLVVDEWNATATSWRTDVCMHQLFEEQVDRGPDAVAVVDASGRTLSYREVEERANRIAHHLRSLGVGAKGLVAAFLDRTADIPPAVLGIQKAGAGYVPLETHWPKARIETILQSLPITAMVTQSQHTADLADLDAPLLAYLVCVDDDTLLDEQPVTRPDNLSRPEDTAYIIFTSGSTGAPKGVEVTHKPAVNLIEWVNTTFSVGVGDRLLFVTSLCFDLSVYDVFGGLASGATVRVASEEEVQDPERLVRVLSEEPITFWDSAPPLLAQLASFLPDTLPTSPLRLVFLSGDWIPVRLPDLLRSVFPDVSVISLGGATEATIWSNWYRIRDVLPEWVSIPYGKPIQNARYYVLDPVLRPCPIGVPGDLFIGGPVLASGYVNDPGLTAEKFVPDPFADEPGARMYRTGDRARFWADGNLEFLGRRDFQVKIRGYRIELGEIESVLAMHPAVADCLVMARSDAGPEKYLAAYIVPSTPDHEPAVSELRSFLRERLPDYMVPRSFVFLPRMPMTPNGKIDRKALPAPELRRDQLGVDYVAPHTPTEELVAEIVARVLGADRVGATDDFFELGGSSLQAVQVVHEIETTFGCRLAVSALLQAPTVGDLADVVTAGTVGPLVVLRTGTRTVPPLFVLHPAGGDVTAYRPLLPHLPPEWPVIGVVSQAAMRASEEHTTLSAMADAYEEAIRQAWPDGPYRLLGWSMGGVLAHAVATRIEARGGVVDVVALVDAAVPDVAPALLANPAFQLSEVFGSLAAVFAELSDDERQVEAAKLLALPEDKRVAETIAWAKMRGAVPANVPDESLTRQVELSRTHAALLRHHRIDGGLAARLVVVWAAGSLVGGQPPMRWGDYGSGEVQETVRPGHHFSLLASSEVLTELAFALARPTGS